MEAVLLVLLGGVLGILGTYLGVHQSSRNSSRESKSNYTRMLHQEFAQILPERSIADKILKEWTKQGKDLVNLFQELGAESNAVFRVRGFFDHLAIAMEQEWIDKSLIPGMFGQVYVYWWRGFFKGWKSHDPDSDERLRHLYSELEKWGKKHPVEWKRWLDSVDKELEAISDKGIAALDSSGNAIAVAKDR